MYTEIRYVTIVKMYFQYRSVYLRHVNDLTCLPTFILFRLNISLRLVNTRQRRPIIEGLPSSLRGNFIIIIIILGLCYHFSPLWRNPSWIASTDVCLGPILSRWFPGADWGHLSILFSVFLVVLTHLRGTQDVALMVHLLSWSLATWPAHRCFDCLMWSMMSVTPVCCLDPGVMSLVAKVWCPA